MTLTSRKSEAVSLSYGALPHPHVVGEVLRHVPHRLLSVGMPRAPERRRYGSPRQHEQAPALDAARLRRSIGDFLGS